MSCRASCCISSMPTKSHPGVLGEFGGSILNCKPNTDKVIRGSEKVMRRSSGQKAEKVVEGHQIRKSKEVMRRSSGHKIRGHGRSSGQIINGGHEEVTRSDNQRS